jgi:hypothetical protein
MPAVKRKSASRTRGKAALAWECRMVCIRGCQANNLLKEAVAYLFWMRKKMGDWAGMWL